MPGAVFPTVYLDQERAAVRPASSCRVRVGDLLELHIIPCPLPQVNRLFGVIDAVIVPFFDARFPFNPKARLQKPKGSNQRLRSPLLGDQDGSGGHEGAAACRVDIPDTSRSKRRNATEFRARQGRTRQKHDAFFFWYC